MRNKVQYRLNFSKTLYNELKGLADDNNTTVAEIMRKGIKWILLAGSIKKKGGRILVERQKGAKLVNVIMP